MEAKENHEKDTAEAMESFLSQFGTMDIYVQIVLEEFFRELLEDGK